MDEAREDVAPLVVSAEQIAGTAGRQQARVAKIALNRRMRRQKIGNTATLTGLPTAAERLGDFSQLGRVIRDPATGNPFPGNRVPTDRFSPIALYYLQFLPVGDENGVAVVRGDDITNFDQITARFDHYFSDNQTINYTLNYFDQAAFDAFAFGGSSVPGFGADDLATTQNHVIRHTYSFSPTLINSLTVAYSRNNFPGVVPASSASPREIGFTGNFIVEESLAGLPLISCDGGLRVFSTSFGGESRPAHAANGCARTLAASSRWRHFWLGHASSWRSARAASQPR